MASKTDLCRAGRQLEPTCSGVKQLGKIEHVYKVSVLTQEDKRRRPTARGDQRRAVHVRVLAMMPGLTKEAQYGVPTAHSCPMLLSNVAIEAATCLEFVLSRYKLGRL